jgi:hypothetical protein
LKSLEDKSFALCAVKYSPETLFHSRVARIPGNTINPLALGEQTPSRFGTPLVSIRGLGLHETQNVRAGFFGSTSNTSTSSEVASHLLFLGSWFSEHMSMLLVLTLANINSMI